MRAERLECKDSACRNHTVQETLSRFEEMRLGTEKGLGMCLRAKINMQDKNGTMRDPVIYRCNLTPHHLTGSLWKICRIPLLLAALLPFPSLNFIFFLLMWVLICVAV
jgi:glutamyl-tRNA synthetase